jgi:hypothetical protein
MERQGTTGKAMSAFTDQLQQLGITPDQQPAQPGGSNWQADLDAIGPKPTAPSGGGSFLDQLNAIGIKPQPQPSPMTSDWRRDLDRLGTQGVAATAAPALAAPAPAAPAPAAPQAPDTDWSALPSHILPDIAETAGDIGHAILHPIQTAQNLADVGMGYLERSGIKTGTEHIPVANAFGQMLADRYGGLDNLKQYAINHPVQAAMDMTTLFSGAGALARGAGMADAADAAATAARLTNPLTPVGAAARMAGKGAAEVIGVGTGTGAIPLQEAAALVSKAVQERKHFAARSPAAMK